MTPDPEFTNSESKLIDVLKIEGAWQTVEGFPQPDWRCIGKYIGQNYPDEEHPGIFEQASFRWVDALRNVLGAEYRIHESKHFLILTTKSPYSSKYTLNVCENILIKIRNHLGSLAWRWTNGKHVILMFEDLDLYYRYISFFYPEEGEFSGSGGVFLNKGYCHTALPPVHDAVPALIHELTHLSLVHLRIPRWLDEGVAVTTENNVKGWGSSDLDADMSASHKTHWNSETIQNFWSGKSFHSPEESRLSYSLARILVENMQNDYSHIKEFIHDANQADHGEASALKHLGVSLNVVAASFLGEGDWSPKPIIEKAKPAKENRPG